MKNFGIYIDESNNLVFSRVVDYVIEQKDIIAINNNAINCINNLSKFKIVDIKENKSNTDVVLKYSNFNLHVLNYKKVLNLEGTSDLVSKIRKYFEHKELFRFNKKKVTRKNKYSKKIIVIGGMALTLFVSGFSMMNSKAKEKNKISNTIQSYSTDNIFKQDNYVTLNNDNLIIENNNIVNNINSIISNNDKIIFNNEIKYEENINDNIEQEKFYVEYEDRSQTDKAYTTKMLYSDTINKYSKLYGLDPTLVTAIATQERGIHSEIMDSGGATGLMQIQNSVWENGNLSAYNYETCSMEHIIVDVNKLSDLDYNIKIGCMILQNNLEYMNYNVFAATQSYNMGYGNMKKILNQYSIDTGKTIDEILNSNDLGWLDYRNIINVGDQFYLEHVLSWIGDDVEINNLNKEKKEIKTHILCGEEVKKVNN